MKVKLKNKEFPNKTREYFDESNEDSNIEKPSITPNPRNSIISSEFESENPYKLLPIN